MLAPMQCFQNALAYLASAVSYTCKMFMALLITDEIKGQKNVYSKTVL
jgi:hypothetical protein